MLIGFSSQTADITCLTSRAIQSPENLKYK